MSVMHVVQLVVLAALAGTVIERVLAIAVHGPIDGDAFVRGLKSAPEARRRVWVERAGRAFVARACAPYALAGADERDVELEEALLDAERAVIARLQWIRIGASISTLFGFIGAAIPLGSLHYGEHGLAALDPHRLERAAMAEAAISIALGVGGSSFALGSWLTLRGLARTLISECARAVDRLKARN